MGGGGRVGRHQGDKAALAALGEVLLDENLRVGRVHVEVVDMAGNGGGNIGACPAGRHGPGGIYLRGSKSGDGGGG